MARRSTAAAVSIWLVFAATPAVAATESSPDGPWVLWQAYWEETAPNDGFSYFLIEEGDATLYADVGIVAFRSGSRARRVVIDVEHAWTDGDESRSVTVRHWGVDGELWRGRNGTYCGAWESRWKVLDPRPLQQRLRDAGLPPMVPRGQGGFDGCVEIGPNGWRSIWATVDAEVRWRTAS